MTEAAVEALPRLLTALDALYAGAGSGRPELAGLLAALRPALRPRPAEQRPARREKPACSLLPQVLAAGREGPLAAVVEAFAAVEPALAWTQNPNYSDARLGAGYMAGYAYAEVVGAGGLAAAEGVAIGVLLLGPGRLYPDHNHPAAELYHVLSGTAAWRAGEGPYLPRSPGSAIYHPPYVSHAMRVGDEPLFALYAWVGEVTTAADLLPASPTPATLVRRGEAC